MRHNVPVRRVVLSSALVLALVACSDDLPTASEPSGVAAPSVIRVAGGAGDAKSVGAAAPEAASTMVADDRMMPMPCGPVNDFRLVGDLPTLDTPGDGWRYTMASDLDSGTATRLASVFGVQGDLVEQRADWGGGWRIGPEDGSAPALYFGADGLGWWSYSAPWSAMPEAEIIAVDPGGSDIETAVEPEPPVGVPDAATAEALARTLLDQVGIVFGDADLEVYADQWNASVTVWHVLDGMRTGYATWLGFGENAELNYASGQLNQPERVNGFERVGTTAAFERLSTGAGAWWGGPAVKMIPCAPEAGATTTVDIVGVEEAWWTLYDLDGTVWLVPGYTFVDAVGSEYLVPAVTDDLVEPAPLPEPMPVEPMPVEPMPEPGVVEPGYDPDAPVSNEPVSNEPAERLIGLSEDEAVGAAKDLGFELRVTERDGEAFPVTADYRLDRINVVVARGVVVKASIG